MSGLDEVLAELAQRIGEVVLRGLREGDPGWVDQTTSPLGPRRHCAAVQRRVRSGIAGASVVGRRYLLSTEALAEELSRLSAEREKKIGGQAVVSTTPRESARSQLEQRLRALENKRRS